MTGLLMMHWAMLWKLLELENFWGDSSIVHVPLSLSVMTKSSELLFC